MPRPVTNNAVAAVSTDAGTWLFSFMGLGAGKTWRDTLSNSYVFDPNTGAWREIDPVPGDAGRLAGTAVTIGQRVFVFGGYTVAEDHSEVSVPTVHALDVRTLQFERRAPMPVPVDDAVSLPYAGRYIYLVSGWHDSGNVNLVQIYDTETDQWAQATPYPGPPVFGHAGGIAGRTVVICDGVKIAVSRHERRRFAASSDCYQGDIDARNPQRIDWRSLPPHPGPPLYRAAATGVGGADGMVVFAGGSDNPYNYNGIGYNGTPSQPSAEVIGFSIRDRSWRVLGKLDTPTMDHRGLLSQNDQLLILGGMRAQQTVSAGVLAFRVPVPPESE